MSAEQDVKDALFASAPLLALVGTASDGTVKIFPDEVPEADTSGQRVDPPAITYERNDTQCEYTLDGALAAARISMNTATFAKTRVEANAIALAVSGAMRDAGLSPTPAKGGEGTGGNSDYVEDLDLYVAVRPFDVWEL